MFSVVYFLFALVVMNGAHSTDKIKKRAHSISILLNTNAEGKSVLLTAAYFFFATR